MRKSVIFWSSRILPLVNLPRILYGRSILMNRTAPMKTLLLLPLSAAFLLSGCVNPIDPLGPIGKGPMPRPAKSKPHPGEKFAWGISTASYQYEDPAVKPGQKDGFLTDWDILISQHKAPEKGNALYSWTRFEKDLSLIHI